MSSSKSSLQLTGGVYKGHRLKCPHGSRPTQGKIRQAIFSMLFHHWKWETDLPERAIDLCAGSGALGFEAISRGAKSVVFVDRGRSQTEVIRENAEKLRLNSENFTVVCQPAETFLKNAGKAQKFEGRQIVFCDPPYAQEPSEWWSKVSESPLLRSGDACVMELEKTGQLQLSSEWAMMSEKIYGLTKICLILKN